MVTGDERGGESRIGQSSMAELGARVEYHVDISPVRSQGQPWHRPQRGDIHYKRKAAFDSSRVCFPVTELTCEPVELGSFISNADFPAR